MKKKLFGSRFRAVLSVILCFAIAVAFWFFVKYSQQNSGDISLIIQSLGI